MALQFHCEKCDDQISVKFLNKGNEAKCPHCGHINIVPENATGEIESSILKNNTESDVCEHDNIKNSNQTIKNFNSKVNEVSSANSNKNIIYLLILVGILIIFAISNPPEDRHISEVRKFLLQNVTSDFDNADNNWEIFGQALGMVLSNKIIESFISLAIEVDNYVLFSITKVKWDNTERVIGYGILGNVWIRRQLIKSFQNQTTEGEQKTTYNNLNNLEKEIIENEMSLQDEARKVRKRDIVRARKVTSTQARTIDETRLYEYYFWFNSALKTVPKNAELTVYNITRDSRIFAKYDNTYGYLLYMKLDIPKWFVESGRK